MLRRTPYLRLHLVLVAIAFAALALVIMPRDADAQLSHANIEDPWADAREAYRAQNWTSARRFAAIASQRDPAEPRYYLSLARIAFQQAQFEDAVWFYDIFLEYAGRTPDAYTGSYAIERGVAERESANARRDDPSASAREPEAQVRVREALLERLRNSVVVDEGGGGAIATFQSLLQIGYANPDLQQLRATLDQSAHAEAARYLRDDQATLPALSYAQWQQQSRRYDASARLLPPPRPFDGGDPAAAPTSPSAAYRALAEGQMQYLLQNWGNAEHSFREAIARAPNLALAHHGLLNALWAASPVDAEALAVALEGFERATPDDVALPLYRALRDAAAGDVSRASDALHGILKAGVVTH